MPWMLLLICLLLVAAVGWRLVGLDRPDRRWRSQLQHIAWIGAHAAIVGGGVWSTAAAARGAIPPEPVAAMMAGICLLFVGRWRRRTSERATA